MPVTHFNPSVAAEVSAAAFLTGNPQLSSEYAVITTGLDGLIESWNEGARRLYGYLSSELVGRRKAEILHVPEDIKAQRPRQILETALAKGKCEATLQCQRRDGQRFSARMATTPRLAPGGAPIGFLLVCKDISGELGMWEDAKAGRYYLRSLFESNPDALVVTDPMGAITDVNHKAETLTGLRRDQLIGTPWRSHFTAPEWADAAIYRALSRGGVADYELSCRAQDGRRTITACNARAISDSEGRPQGVLVALRDVGEAKRIESDLLETNAELEDALRAKDRFVASVSHELRTPLSTIIGFCAALTMKPAGTLDADREEQLRIIETSAKHALALIGDLLELSKVESGNVALNLEPVGCRAALQEIGEELRPHAQRKGLALEIHGPGEEVLVRTDRRVLHHIVGNLINNAIKYTDRGRVTVELLQTGDPTQTRTAITVRDTGIGIKREDYVKLFRPFSQLSSGRRRREGAGLGLYLSQKLAPLIGAQISLESEYGKGSAFTLTLRGAQP